jgi:hypothetical protein
LPGPAPRPDLNGERKLPLRDCSSCSVGRARRCRGGFWGGTGRKPMLTSPPTPRRRHALQGRSSESASRPSRHPSRFPSRLRRASAAALRVGSRLGAGRRPGPRLSRPPLGPNRPGPRPRARAARLGRSARLRVVTVGAGMRRAESRLLRPARTRPARAGASRPGGGQGKGGAGGQSST